MFFNKEMTNEFQDYVNMIFKTYSNDAPSYEGFIDTYSCIDTVKLNQQLELISRDFKNVIIFPKNISVDDWYKNPRHSFKKQCLTCFKRINIEPNGDVIACTDFPETCYGNVLKDSIYNIFNNKIIKQHRKTIDVTKGICPRCSYLYVY
jgi:radical SAM protein with 4Fe4S-binding SPASM domain